MNTPNTLSNLEKNFKPTVQHGMKSPGNNNYNNSYNNMQKSPQKQSFHINPKFGNEKKESYIYSPPKNKYKSKNKNISPRNSPVTVPVQQSDEIKTPNCDTSDSKIQSPNKQKFNKNNVINKSNNVFKKYPNYPPKQEFRNVVNMEAVNHFSTKNAPPYIMFGKKSYRITINEKCLICNNTNHIDEYCPLSCNQGYINAWRANKDVHQESLFLF